MPKDIPKMPDGLEDLLRGLSKAVFKEKPLNILDFSAKYFENLLIERDGSLMKNYERFEHYEKSLNKLVNQKKTGDDSVKKSVKSVGKNGKTIIKTKVAKRVPNPKPNVKVSQNKEKVPSPVFGDKVVEQEPTRKIMDTVVPKSKLKTRTRSSISLNAITEESSSEMKEERRMMYRNAVKKIQRAFRKYIETKKQKSISIESSKSQIMDEDKAARIIQNLFKLKFPKKTKPQPRPRSIKNKNLERVAEGGEDSKSLLEYLQEEENAKKTQPNIEHDSDTGEITRVNGVNISNADSLENMIINEDMNREQNSKNMNLTLKLPDNENHNDQERAAIKIQSTYRGYQTRKDIKQQRELGTVPSIPAPTIDDDIVMMHKNNGEMENAAIRIQKNYRGYKVRKDILSTKNLVNSGNLVAAAGNIIGSVVNNLNPSDSHSNNESAEINQLPSNDVHSEKINPEGLPTYDEISNTVTKTAEVVNSVNIGTDDKESQDSNSPSTKSEVQLQGSSVSEPEVSVNSTQDIEHIIGINKQEPDSEPITTKLEIAKTSQIPESSHGIAVDIPEQGSDPITVKTTIAENLQIPADIHDGLFVPSNIVEDAKSVIETTTPELQLSKTETKTVVTNEIPDGITNKEPTSENSVEIDSSSKTPTITSGIKSEQESTPKHSAEIDISNSIPTITGGNKSEQEPTPEHSVETNTPSEILTITEGSNSEQEPTPEHSVQAESPSKISTISGESKSEQEATPKHSAENDTSSRIPTITGENKLEDEPMSIITDTAVHESANQVVGSLEEINEPKHEIVSLANEASTIRDDTLLDRDTNINEIPIKTENLQGVESVINPADSNHETQSPSIELNTLKHNLIETQNIDDSVNDTKLDLHDTKVTDATDNETEQAQLTHLRIIPEVTIDGASEEIPSDSELMDDNHNAILKSEPVPQGTQKNLLDLNNQVMKEAAVVIQKSFRGHQVRQNLKAKKTSTSELDNSSVPSIFPEKDENQTHFSHTEVQDKANVSVPDQHIAAVKIQKTYRGHQVRKELKQKNTQISNLNETVDKHTIGDNIDRSSLIKTKDVIENNENNANPSVDESNEVTVQKQDSLPDLNDPEIVDAALKIQKALLGKNLTRKERNQQKLENVTENSINSKSSENDVANTKNIEIADELVTSPDDDNTKSSIQPVHMEVIPSSVEPKAQESNVINSSLNSVEEPKVANFSSSAATLTDPGKDDAAIKIQKTYRGHRGRKAYKQKKDEAEQKKLSDSDNVKNPQELSNEPHSASLNTTDLKPVNNTILTPAVDDILQPETTTGSDNQMITNNFVAEKQDSLPDLNDPEIADAALKIQKSFRGHQARKDVNNIRKKRSIDLEAEPTNNLVELDLSAPHEQIDALRSEHDTQNLTSNQIDHLMNLDGPMITDGDSNSHVTTVTSVTNDVQLQPETTAVSTHDRLLPEKQDSLPDLNDPEMADAALKIQKSFRGHQARKDENNIRKKRSLDLKTEPSYNSTESDLPLSKEQIDSMGTENELQNSTLNKTNIVPNVEDTLITDSAPDNNELKSSDTVMENHDDKTENTLTLTSATDDVPLQPETDSSVPLANNMLPATEKQDSLPDLTDPEMAEAALKIQKSFRGHQTRKDEKIKERQSEDLAAELPPSNLETLPISNKSSQESKSDKQNSTTHQSGSLSSETNGVLESQDSLPDLNDPEMADAALKIQKSFRSHQTRKELQQHKNGQFDAPIDDVANVTTAMSLEKPVTAAVENIANPPIAQDPIIVTSTLMEQQESLPDLNDPEMADAALKIQKSFRGHQARKGDIKLDKQAIVSTEPVEDKQNNLQDTRIDQSQDKVLTDSTAMVSSVTLTEDHKIVEDDNLMEHNKKFEHDNSLPDLNDPEMANAALKIQKSFRGHQARKGEIKSDKQAIVSTEPAMDKQIDLQDTSIDQSQDKVLTNSTATVSSITPTEDNKIVEDDNLMEHNKKVEHDDSLPDLNDPEMADAALKIQKSFRGHQARRGIKATEHDKSAENLEDSSSDTTSNMNASIACTNDEKQDNSSLIPDPNMDKISTMEHQDSLPEVNISDVVDAVPEIQNSVSKELNQPGINDMTSKASPVQVDNETVIRPQVEHKDNLPYLDDPNTLTKGTNETPNIDANKKQISESTSNLPETLENDSNIANPPDEKLVGSVEKQDSLPDLNDPEMGDAALKIQKSFRGHKARKELQEAKESKILSEATAPLVDDIGENESSSLITQPVDSKKDHDLVETVTESPTTPESKILNNIAPDIISKATESAAINIQRTYRGYRTRRDLKSQNTPQPTAGDVFEDENKLVDSLEPILDQKTEDKIDADSLDNFNVDEKSEVVEEPCQKVVYKSKLSMLIENSKSDTQSSSSDRIESKPNDDYFDSLENTQTSEMDESAQTVIEGQQPNSMVDTSVEGQNTYDSSIFGLKIEPKDIGELEQPDVKDDSISRKTTAEVKIPGTNVETRGGMTDDEIKEIQNIDLASFEKDSLEAMYYSLRKNELLIDQMHSLANVEQIADQTEPIRQFTGKQKLMSMGESDSDDIVFKQLSIDYDEYSENSNQHTARSTTDDDADVEVVRDVLYYNDGKQVVPNQREGKREPGDGASVASDNLFDNHSNADDQDILPGKQSSHHFGIFSLDEEIKNLESNDTSYQQDNPLFYAQQKIEKYLHQIHGNMNETEDDADDENDDNFLDNPIDSNKSYLSENNFNADDEEEDDVVDEMRTDFRELSARKVLSSAVSEADSDYVEQSRIKPIKDDFNISTALDNYLSTDSDSTYNSAATKIQAGARGFLTRRRIQSVNRQSISERRSSIGNAAIDQSLDDMIEENEERKKFKFHEAQSTFREDTITSSGEMEMYGITDIKVEEKKIASPITDSGNESTTSIDAETQAHLRNKYERLENESSFDAIDEDKLSDVVDVIRTSNVQNKLHSPIKNKALSNVNFDEYDRVATRRMTLQRGNAVQGNSTPSDDESRGHSNIGDTPTTISDATNEKENTTKKTSYDSPIRRKSTDSASVMTKSSNSLPDLQNSPKRRGFIQRQRTMPVQIETEIIRQLPKHMRKRIKSANSSAHSSHHASNLFKKKATY